MVVNVFILKCDTTTWKEEQLGISFEKKNIQNALRAFCEQSARVANWKSVIFVNAYVCCTFILSRLHYLCANKRRITTLFLSEATAASSSLLLYGIYHSLVLMALIAVRLYNRHKYRIHLTLLCSRAVGILYSSCSLAPFIHNNVSS